MNFQINMMDGHKIKITESQKDELLKAVQSGREMVIIANAMINIKSISSVVDSQTAQIKNAYQNGEWVCDYGFRHLKGEHCACGYHAKNGTEPDRYYLIDGADGKKPMLDMPIGMKGMRQLTSQMLKKLNYNKDKED